MSVPRFYVAADLTVGGEIPLPANVAHHARNVLRLRAGDPLVLFNGGGGEFHARLTGAGGAAIEAFDPVERESPLAVTLIQALIAQDRLDWVIEKATELGVAQIVVVAAARSVVRLDERRRLARLARWREIAIAACCQCGRNRIPDIRWAPDLPRALADVAADAGFLLVPRADNGIQRAEAGGRLALAVGPEGDWTTAEIAAGQRRGYRLARLGPRTLRTETAALAAVAAVQAAFGDLDVARA
ncbi:MAG: 16S rRNA (uracil(1498)-N(3))-methyltransferase [Burkholderiaceae bacterium]|nr:16S rRNA (uracil(1498)-N(3))-methyltransferase [Burkholderiaceae bacterium]